jgi:hypothetical protein
MARRISDGKSYKATVPVSTTVVAGTFYDFDGVLGMAFEDVVTGAGATGLVAVEVDTAEYETSQIDAAQAFGLGARLYWDPIANRFTTVATANVEVGYVTSAKDANNVIWFRRTTLVKVA